VLERCREKRVVSALFYPDVYLDNPSHRVDQRLLADVDLLFTTKSFHAEYLDALRGPGRWAFVHHGYSPLVHRPHHSAVGEDEFLYDIAYIGNPDARKLAWLIEIARRFPEKRILVAGDRWRQLASGTPLEGRTAPGRITGDLMAEVVQRSRINLGILAAPDDPRGWRDRVSTRTFEIPACGGFMLHEDNEEVRELFEPDSEFGAFAGLDELCEKIAGYLAEPARRAAIALAGHRRAVPAYSYYERAREISARVDALY
jgi:spore maturation protein CgeB